MSFSAFDLYFLIINLLGFAVGAVNSRVSSKKPEGKSDAVLALLSVLGGAVGCLLSVLIFDRKAEKGNMLSRVIMSCLSVIDVIILLMVKGTLSGKLSFAFWDVFVKYPYALVYVGLVNVISFVLYGLDKRKAVKGKNRIRIVTLLGSAFIGGSVGSLAGMYLFRHKTDKNYFYIGVPLMVVMQVFVLFYLSNLLC